MNRAIAVIRPVNNVLISSNRVSSMTILLSLAVPFLLFACLGSFQNVHFPLNVSVCS